MRLPVTVDPDSADSAARGPATLGRRAFAEFLGTALLVAVVVGSGVAAQRLSPHDVGLELLENALVTGLALAALIAMLGPVSGAHLNPWVSAADWALGRSAGTGLRAGELAGYVVSQLGGGCAGALLANAMFDAGQHLGTTHRASWSHLLSEVVATAVLVVLVFALARTGQGRLAGAAVGATVAAGYFWTSSTFFANAAAALGRALTNTFAGIAPASLPGFVGAQALGTGVGIVVIRMLYPTVAATAGDVVVPHGADPSSSAHLSASKEP